jgi:hypothetical protein
MTGGGGWGGGLEAGGGIAGKRTIEFHPQAYSCLRKGQKAWFSFRLRNKSGAIFQNKQLQYAVVELYLCTRVQKIEITDLFHSAFNHAYVYSREPVFRTPCMQYRWY